MLVRFEVGNYRSIAEPIELSLVAVDSDREAARYIAGLDHRILTRAAIFGANASGKSNVLGALTWLVNAVTVSLKSWEEFIPIEPFALDSRISEPSEFSIDFVLDEVRYQYNLEVARTGVLREELYYYPGGAPRSVFSRSGDVVDIAEDVGSASPFMELLTPTTLMLSLARRFDLKIAADFARSLTQTQVLGRGITRRSVRHMINRPSTATLFDDKMLDWTAAKERRRWREQALNLLRYADLGISNVKVERTELPSDDDIAPGSLSYSRRTVRMLHEGADGAVPFDLDDESEGTRAWFALIAPVLQSLDRGTPLVVDELDLSLHPILSAQLLKLYHDLGTNPNNAQLIFTSHDTSLLSHLNRDEVWLTQKRADGSTELEPLSEFAIRSSSDIEAEYLRGRYGGVPELDRYRLRDLGIVG